MRILRKEKGSVLWLLKSNQWAEKNLKIEAEKRGIKSHRIIFAEPLPHSEHLARHKHADLFIDTFNYNAHTTMSDALWAGLPAVTKLGKSFASRVGGSLLNAIGLPELVTKNKHDYEALIIDLAVNKEKLQMVKKKLNENRLSKPLYNTELYLKHLEYSYKTAYKNYYDDKVPRMIFVPECI